MTDFNIALSAPQYTALRSGHYAGNQLIKLFSNRIVLHGTITTDLSLVKAWAQFNYTLISGTYSSVVRDQVLVISQTNDLATACNTWYGRVRAVPTSGIVYSNESSVNFTSGAYFWVLDTYLPQYKLSRPSTNDPATAIELWDYNNVFEPLQPVGKGLPTCIGGYPWIGGKFRYAFDLSRFYAANAGNTISSYQISANGTIVAGSAATAFAVYDFDIGEQWAQITVTDDAGRNVTRHVGVQILDDSTNPPDTGFGPETRLEQKVDEGWTLTTPAFANVDSLLNNTLAMVIRTREQYGRDANGIPVTRTLWGGSSATVTNKALTSNVATLTANNSFEVGQQVVVVIGDSVFDGTHIITAASATQFSYAKVNANVASTSASGLAVVNPDNIDFVGWFQRETDTVQSDQKAAIISTANFTFTGPGPRLSRLMAQLTRVYQATSPSVANQIATLTPWRVFIHYLQRYTTVASLVDLVVDDTAATYQFPEIPTAGGNVQSNLTTIGKQINTSLTYDPRGTIGFNRSAEFLNQAGRNALVEVATWTSQDMLSISREFEPNPNTGRVDGDSAFYNPTNAQVTVFTARAPGIAMGEAPGANTIPSQILVATTDAAVALADIEARVGTQLLIDNNTEVLDIEHPGGYIAIPIIATRSQLYSLSIATTLAGAKGVNRIVYTSSQKWWVESVTSAYNAKRGARTCKVRYRKLVPLPSPGDDTTQITTGQTGSTLPEFGLPAFDFDLPELTIPDAGLTLSTIPPSALLTPKGKIVTFTGQELLIWSDAQVAFLRNFINLTTPQSSDITPGAPLGSIKQGAVDPFYTDNAVPGYLLENNGINSRIAWNPNIAAPGAGAAWLDGVNLGDVFDVIRTTNVGGAVLVYGVSTGALPPPAPPNCIDPAAFPLYATLLYGSYGSPGYSSGQNLRNTETGTNPYDPTVPLRPVGAVRYTFSSAVTVTRVKVRAYSTTGDGFFVSAFFYNGTTLLQETTVKGPFGNTSWVLFDLMSGLTPGPTGPVANVTKVEVAIWGNNADLYRLSDADICYE